MNSSSPTKAVALQRCGQFVGRTMNWLYDHLRFVPHYVPVVLCNELLNRVEFPELEARCLERKSFTHRLWRRFAGDRLSPSDMRWLGRLAPCVFHSHFGNVAVKDLALQQLSGAPWIVSFYGADAYQLGRRAEWQEMYAQVFDQAMRVLALGPVMKAQLERIGCPAEKIVIHPLGVDVENLPCRSRILKRDEPLKILFAGTFREKKGIQYVIEAAALARQAGVKFELQLVGDEMGKSGDQETKEEVFRQIRYLDLESVATYYKFLPFQKLIDLALRSHIFVAPSVTAMDGDSEGTPFVLQQLMATGMPAIATFHSDIPYLFGDYQNLLVPERNARAIADHLQRYAGDPDALIEDGKKLRERIRTTFNVQSCAASLSNIYEAI